MCVVCVSTVILYIAVYVPIHGGVGGGGGHALGEEVTDMEVRRGQFQKQSGLNRGGGGAN